MKKQPKIGDLVKYDDPEQGFAIETIGIVTDVMEFEDGSFPMYEVISSDTYDRGWYSYDALEVING